MKNDLGKTGRLLAAAILVWSWQAQAQETDNTGAGCAADVEYRIVNQWNDGFTGQVRLINDGSEPLDGWNLTWTMPDGQQIYHAWNGQAVQTGAAVTVTPAAYNATIEVDGQVEFGFNANHTGINTIPQDIALNGVPCGADEPEPEPDPIACSVDYSVLNQWGNGFTAEVRIDNHGSALSGWTLTWSMDNGQRLTGSWNGQFSQSGAEVQVANADYNAHLPVDGSVSFGFNASHNGTNDIPTDFALNGVACNGPDDGGDDPPVDLTPGSFGLVPYVSGLIQPVALVNAGDQRLFVAEQGGRIRVIDPDGNLLPQPFLDISDQVVVGAEEGLLSLVFHPDFATNGYVFVYYIAATADGNRSRIARYTVDAADPNRADAASETLILEFAQPNVGHKGGTLAFGADGLLYASFGDGHTVPFPHEGGVGDPLDSAQNDGKLLGKLVRLDVDIAPGSGNGDCDLSGNHHYRIPADNAYSNGPGGGCDEIYASGLRNPWRFSFDAATGDLWLGDVGYAEREEINVVPADTPGGLNFGWRCYEGSQAYNLDGCPAPDGFTFPVHDYGHDAGKCSVTGGYVYRGSRYPDLVGHYLFSDWCHTAVSALKGAPDAVEVVEIIPPGAVTYPTAFGEDVDGELYVVSLIPGTIFRVVTADEASAVNNQPTTGQELYLAKGCAGCHGIDGSGIFGPPLSGPYLDRSALVEQIDTTMPFLSAVACTDECAGLVADYILATFADGGDDDDDNTGVCAVNYTIANQWPTGFTAQVQLTNTGAADLDAWQLAWTMPDGQIVTQSWDGDFVQDGAQVTISNKSYNAALPVDGSVNFGFNAEHNGSNAVPTEFTLNGVPCGGDDGGDDGHLGETLYLERGCADCHGVSGEGVGNFPSLIKTYESRDALVQRIVTTMPFGDPGACDAECADWIADYILTRFAVPDPDEPDPVACSEEIPGPRLLRLLTRREYDATVQDLLGVTTPLSASFPVEPRVEGYDNNADANVVTVRHLESYLAAAQDLAQRALADNPTAILSCDLAAAECPRQIAETLGLRAYRRPPSATEIERLLDVYATGSSPEQGVELMVSALLISPNFLYRSELGDAVGGGNYRLTPYEVATSLSYLFWGSMPDDALFAAAAAGELATAQQRLAQAERLLADPRSRRWLGLFFAQYLGADPLQTGEKNTDVFPAYSLEVQEAMDAELVAFVNHVIFDSSGQFSELFTADYAMVNDTLATFYGLNPVSGSTLAPQTVTDGSRGGLLALGSVLSHHAHADDASPVRRGVFVRKRVLCHDLPPPPPTVDNTPPGLDPTLTTRERFAVHSESPFCQVCHQYIDGVGFGFERYDGAGSYRELENGIPVDDSGEILGLEDFDPSDLQAPVSLLPFQGLGELSGLIATSESATRCLATQYHRFAFGYAVGAADTCRIDNLHQRFADSGYDLRALLLGLVAAPTFDLRRDVTEENR